MACCICLDNGWKQHCSSDSPKSIVLSKGIVSSEQKWTQDQYKIHQKVHTWRFLYGSNMTSIIFICQYQLLEVWPSHGNHGNHGNHDRIGQLGEFPVFSPPSHVETRRQGHWVQSLRVFTLYPWRSVEYKESTLPVERCWNILAARECMGLIIDRLGWVYLEEMRAKLAQKWEMEVVRMPKGSDTDTHRIHWTDIFTYLYHKNQP